MSSTVVLTYVSSSPKVFWVSNSQNWLGNFHNSFFVHFVCRQTDLILILALNRSTYRKCADAEFVRQFKRMEFPLIIIKQFSYLIENFLLFLLWNILYFISWVFCLWKCFNEMYKSYGVLRPVVIIASTIAIVSVSVKSKLCLSLARMKNHFPFSSLINK